MTDTTVGVIAMSLSTSVENYLSDSHIGYKVLEHPYSYNAIQTAKISHITPAHLAKAVVVKAGATYLMCVLPASHVLVLNWIDRDYSAGHSGHHQLVTEEELKGLFPDCELGAIPALGQAFDMKVVWDSSLRHADEVYLEAGDHRHIFQLSGQGFIEVMEKSDHATISCTPDTLKFYQHLH